ncbi:MAG: DUF1003 domain-containing protein [Bacteroidota bacterium]
MENNIPKTVDELKKQRKPYQEILKKHKKKVTGLDKLALWITEHVGSMKFFLIIFTWTVFWLGWNMLAPVKLRFDPFPAFVLWLFISNMIQLFLMPLIMVGQNLQSAASDMRSEADYEVNKQAEQEIETILLHLENHQRIMEEILHRLDDQKKAETN